MCEMNRLVLLFNKYQTTATCYGLAHVINEADALPVLLQRIYNNIFQELFESQGTFCSGYP